MRIFVWVLGDDPFYTGRKTRVLIRLDSIQKIVPLYAVKGADGTYWRSLPEHPDAKVYSYQITDIGGNTYTCGNPKTLEILGITEPQPKGQLGFVKQEGSEDIQAELSKE